jgi:hypothetical protein
MKLREIITPAQNYPQIDESWEENLTKAKDWVYNQLFKSDMPIMATAAVATAAAIITKFPILRAVELALGGAFLVDHYKQLQDLYDQYARYKAGDRHTELFGNASQKEAEQIAFDTRNQLMGEMALSAGAITKVSSKAFAFLSKLLTGAGKSAGKLLLGRGGKAMGGAIGGAFGLPFKVVSLLAKIIEGGVAGAAFQAFLASDAGKEFLKNSIVQAVTTGTITVASDFYEQLLAILKSVGIDVPDFLEPEIKNPEGSHPNPDAISGKVISDNPRWKSRPLQVAYDRNNKKIMYVNDIQITDADGFQKVGDRMIQDIRDTARVYNNAPDPTAGIPKKPGARYSF